MRNRCPVFLGKKIKNTYKHFKIKMLYDIIEIKVGEKTYFTCNY